MIVRARTQLNDALIESCRAQTYIDWKHRRTASREALAAAGL